MYKKIYRNMRFICIITLILSVLMLLAVFYSVFNSTLQKDLENDTLLIRDFLNKSENVVSSLKNINNESKQLRFTLISPDGKVLYDSNESYESFSAHKNRPEFENALKYGIGTDYRYSDSLSKKFYYCAVSLDNGMVFRVAKTTFDMMSLFYMLFIFILLMLIAIYIFSGYIAAKLTASIVKPLSDNSLDEYDEMRPFKQQIESQSKEIKRQIENASHREKEHRLITDNMNEGLIVLDKEGHILSLNNFAMKIFNIHSYDVKQKNYRILTDNEIFNSAVEKALKRSRNESLVEMGEAEYRVFCSPVMKSGNLNGIVILMFDVTATSQSEKLRREFSANVSHELKTPLTSINGYAQLISSKMAANEDIPAFAEKIAKESNRLMILIDDIMHLSKLDEDFSPVEKVTFSIKDVVSEVIATLNKKAESRNISFKCEGADFYVTSHKTQVTELITNLCDNAIKYNKDNGSVTITLSDKTLSIADTGIGIPAEYIGRIFERFFRVDKSHSKKVDGTGLGLSIVKHIAKINNIGIDVKSQVGKGTVFLLTFS